MQVISRVEYANRRCPMTSARVHNTLRETGIGVGKTQFTGACPYVEGAQVEIPGECPRKTGCDIYEKSSSVRMPF